jgi:hypothetical protein
MPHLPAHAVRPLPEVFVRDHPNMPDADTTDATRVNMDEIAAWSMTDTTEKDTEVE